MVTARVSARPTGRRPGTVALAVAALTTAGLATVLTTGSADAADASGLDRRGAPLVKVAGAIPGSYIVMLEDGTSAKGLRAAKEGTRAAGGEIADTFRNLDAYAADLSAAELAAVRADPRVAFVQQDGVLSIQATQSGATWGLDRTDQRTRPLSGTYSYTTTGAGVTAYVIDTGINSAHTDLSGRVAAGFTAISDGRGSQDCNGHGTHVAGTVGGRTYGVAKSVTLVPVRVLDCRGSGTNAGVIAGMDWVAGRGGPSVANMSLGGGASTAVDAAVARMVSRGVTTVVAAGNENQNACNVSPARASSAITVAASTITDTRASFSNYGSCVDLFAPGQDITSAWIGGTTSTRTISGTSMAAPHVAGAAARYLQAFPGSSPAQVTSGLLGTSTTNVVTGANGSPNRLLYAAP